MKQSFIINKVEWVIKYLGSEAILLEAKAPVPLSTIHHISTQISISNIQGLIETVPAYQSIAVFFDLKKIQSSELIQAIRQTDFEQLPEQQISIIHKIPICFDLGLDWDEVCAITQLEKTVFIQKFISTTYTVAMLGFIPGFMYLDGLEDILHCPRKQNPRKSLPAGSVGIGGRQTGIYALSSPGGWQIIGQTPMTLFKKNQMPPTDINPMDKVQFYEIDVLTFENSLVS